MSAAVRPGGLAFPLNGESRQEDWYNAVLAERHPVFGMAGHLENELPISAFVEKLALGRAPHWRPQRTNERELKLDSNVMMSGSESDRFRCHAFPPDFFAHDTLRNRTSAQAEPGAR